MEIWKPVKDYENLYEVSNLGKIRSLDHITEQKNCFGAISKVEYKGKVLNPPVINGYRRIQLYKNGKRKIVYIHRLVAEAFIPNPNNLPEVDHRNGFKLDNRVNNLRWVTSKENKENAKNNGHDFTKQYNTGIYYGNKGIHCEELNMDFPSLLDAAKYIIQKDNLNMNPITVKKNIHRTCRNGHGTTCKYHWSFN